ncbi:MarR family winged helix-turn-helix transcriptional regulator [Thioalkalivibrio sp. HK1]|uniref:MarR family winged helix-turn-helix transcriptional regulator n=1 Tax=Thioalkalivibrio sp. HK1 TaxID=1469245 RepID=UPI0004726911|nr:MarR family winged helix-turn-helix transcriptional regulator [Thioalkalivibrio sp. HK1]
MTEPLQPQQFLTYRLAFVQSRLNRQALRILSRNFGLTLSEWRVLALISGSKETSSRSLTEISTMDKGLVSRTIKGLVKAGLLQGRTNTADHRQYLWSPTRKGHALYKAALPVMRKRQRYLRASLDETQLHHLLSALSVLESAAEKTDF